jgi:hypothetical protein
VGGVLGSSESAATTVGEGVGGSALHGPVSAKTSANSDTEAERLSNESADTMRGARQKRRPASLLTNDFEVRHHSGRVMLEDVAVVHPFTGPVVR